MRSYNFNDGQRVMTNQKNMTLKIGLSLIILLLTAPGSFAQDSVAYRATISNNTFVYSGNTIKVFSGQRISVSAVSNNRRLENISLLDTGRTKIESAKIINVLVQQNAEKNICIDLHKQERQKMILSQDSR